MRIAFYGDDFTGSVDALLQLRRTGLDGVLHTSPESLASSRGEGAPAVVGIAGVARSLPTPQLEAEVRPALEALLQLRPDVLQYKVCSTADSSPQVGSIGRAVEIGRALVGTAPVPVLLAQPDFGRYTVFSHHFAADRGVVHRLDRHPTMAAHPVTPATESDLRRHLAAQTSLTVGGLPVTAYGTVERPVTPDLGSDGDVLVLDALTDDHLRLVGTAVLGEAERSGRVFVVGSGGLSRALGLAATDVDEVAPVPLPTAVAPAGGRTLVVSGSASALTWQQVQAAAGRGFGVVDLLGAGAGEEVARLLADGTDVVVHSASPGGPLRASGTEVAAGLAAIAERALRTRPTTRLVVCGGDTSGSVLRRLGVASLRIETNPWGMVSLCRATGTAPHLGAGIEIVLKGGQMGHEMLFDDVRTGTALR